ncbi:MAG: cell division protein SepF [Christensenellales bacterium]
MVNVRQIEECREIIKYLLRGESVLLNLENIDPKDCGRVVDLLSGAAFALPGAYAEGRAFVLPACAERMSK